MKFTGKDDTVTCEMCYKEVSDIHIEGHPDYPLCLTCQAAQINEHRKKPCTLCKKPMGNSHYFFNEDDQESTAHEACVKKLPENKKEVWSDEFDW